MAVSALYLYRANTKAISVTALPAHTRENTKSHTRCPALPYAARELSAYRESQSILRDNLPLEQAEDTTPIYIYAYLTKRSRR